MFFKKFMEDRCQRPITIAHPEHSATVIYKMGMKSIFLSLCAVFPIHS